MVSDNHLLDNNVIAYFFLSDASGNASPRPLGIGTHFSMHQIKRSMQSLNAYPRINTNFFYFIWILRFFWFSSSYVVTSSLNISLTWSHVEGALVSKLWKQGVLILDKGSKLLQISLKWTCIENQQFVS